MRDREEKRERRHQRVRTRVIGTKEKPRLSVHRSLRNLYAQLIDDMEQKTLFSYSTLNEPFQKKVKMKKRKGVEIATELGEHFATKAKSKGFSKVVFDRGRCLYHGKIKAFAEACRKHGLSF